MKILLLNILCLFALSGYSQLIVSGQITGQVTNDKNQPVPFATIRIQQPDSTQKTVAEKITDENGKYEIGLQQAGEYIFHISSTGYESLSRKVTVSQEEKQLNFTLQKNAENLNDVTVTSSASMIQRKTDRIVMQVENNPLSSGKSSMEMMNLAPGVLIYNNQITLNGNGGVRVMVDGKMLNLSGQDLANYLNSLRAEDIKSIEVIAHPPAEYDAQGTGGLINIVLKKNRNSGLNGSIYGNYTQGRYAGTSDGININYKKNKFSLFGNGSYYSQKRFEELEQYRTLANNGVFTAKNNFVSTGTNNRQKAGITYDINDNQFISLEYNRAYNKYTSSGNAQTLTTFPDASLNTKTEGTYPGTYAAHYNNAGLRYQLKTDTLGSKFTFLADYTKNKVENTSDIRTFLYNAQNTLLTDTSFRNATPGDAQIYTADAKYAQVFKEGHTFSLGSKLTATRIKNIAFFEYLQNGKWYESIKQNYQYNYDENIVAGYVSYEGVIAKTNVQLGLRGEYTDLTGMLIAQGVQTPNLNKYFSLFPNVYLSKAVNKTGDNTVNFSYNRRFNRPSFHELNPYVGYADNYTIGMGNPFLRPEFNNSYELGFTLKNKYMFTLNYTHNRDIINRVIRNDENDPKVMIQQPLNSGNSDNLMLTVFAPVKITKWWNAQNTAQLSYQKIEAPEYKIEKPIAFLQSQHTFTVNKTTSFTLSGFYISNFIFANGLINPFGMVNAGFSKKFAKDKFTFKANVNDIFYTQTIKGNMSYKDFILGIRSRHQSRTFTVGLTYNFKAGKSFNVKKLQSSSEEEQKRLDKN